VTASDQALTALRALVREVVEEVLAEHRLARDESALLTVAAAAARLSMSASFVRSAIADERLPARKVGGAVRVRVADVDALAANAWTRRPPRAAAAAPEADADALARLLRAGVRGRGGR